MDNIKQALVVTVGLVLLITIASFTIINLRLSDMEHRTEDIINTLCAEGAGSYNLSLIEAREDLNDTLATYLKRLELERRDQPNNDPPPQGGANTQVIAQDLLAQVAYLINMSDSKVNHGNCDQLLDW